MTGSVASPLGEKLERLGDYELVGHLSAGGMATLYLGRRGGPAGFDRHVAIKVVHPHLAADDGFVRMFLEEAKLSAQIQHPNVVHVEQLGEADGRYFLVMEYVHGCSLLELLRALAHQGRALAPSVAVWLAMQVADGLHAAHETKDGEGELLGVVHRDVSPQNVLLSFGGHVKLIDFGIAKTDASHTAAGSLKGKIAYMSPEQARGGKVDRRSDVYSLGVLLWELLTRKRRFHAPHELAVLDQVRDPEERPPRAEVPSLSAELDAAVVCAMKAAPEDRFETARDFRRALAEACPEALRIDAGDVAALLHELMADRIARGRAALPSDVVAGAPEATSASRVEALTTTGSLELGDAMSSASGPQTVPPALAADVASGLRVTPEQRTAELQPAPAAVGTSPMKVVLILAGTGIAALAVGLTAALVWLLVSEPDASVGDSDESVSAATASSSAGSSTEGESVADPTERETSETPSSETDDDPAPVILDQTFEATPLSAGNQRLLIGRPYRSGEIELSIAQVFDGTPGSIVISVDGRPMVVEVGESTPVGEGRLRVDALHFDGVEVTHTEDAEPEASEEPAVERTRPTRTRPARGGRPRGGSGGGATGPTKLPFPELDL